MWKLITSEPEPVRHTISEDREEYSEHYDHTDVVDHVFFVLSGSRPYYVFELGIGFSDKIGHKKWKIGNRRGITGKSIWNFLFSSKHFKIRLERINVYDYREK